MIHLHTFPINSLFCIGIDISGNRGSNRRFTHDDDDDDGAAAATYDNNGGDSDSGVGGDDENDEYSWLIVYQNLNVSTYIGCALTRCMAPAPVNQTLTSVETSWQSRILLEVLSTLRY